MNLLPLETWRAILQYHPFFFWGLANQTVKPTSATALTMRQYAWQAADRASRAEIAQAIENAEKLLIDYLGYAPAPHYVEETLPWPRDYQPELWRLFPMDATGRRLSVTLGEGHVRALGVETITAIETCAVVYSDTDGDGLDDTFTLTTAAPLGTTDPDEIAIYFAAADRLDSELSRWRIQPVTVAIAGGIATIKGRAWTAVRPILYEGVGAADIDPVDATKFAATLEVKRRWTDPNGTTNATCQALLTWETLPRYAGSLDPTSSTDPAATGNAVGRCGIRDAEKGFVTPAEAIYDAATGTWTNSGYELPHRPPDRVTVRYLAGLGLVDGQMEREWQITVARLAAAEMSRIPATNDVANRELYHWQFDLSRAAGRNDEQYRISDDDLSNPFGTRRGHVYAWKKVQNLALLRGILA